MDAATRREFQPRFGHDFSRVHVRTDGAAAASARAVNAAAYTVGSHVVFAARGRYAPGAATGRRLLAHELAHVVQQGAMRREPGRAGRLAVYPPGDVHEQAADAAARRVSGRRSRAPVRAGRRARASAPDAVGATGERAGETRREERAGRSGRRRAKDRGRTGQDENPKVKKFVIEPLKQHFKGEWGRLGRRAKDRCRRLRPGRTGHDGRARLSDPSGRKHLEGVNLAAPFTLIPYMPLSTFKFAQPNGDSADKRLYKFETGFNADGLPTLRTATRGLPKMSLKVNMQWGYDPDADRLSVLGGDASLGLVPGLSLSGGAYKDVLRPAPFVRRARRERPRSRRHSRVRQAGARARRARHAHCGPDDVQTRRPGAAVPQHIQVVCERRHAITSANAHSPHEAAARRQPGRALHVAPPPQTPTVPAPQPCAQRTVDAGSVNTENLR